MVVPGKEVESTLTRAIAVDFTASRGAWILSNDCTTSTTMVCGWELQILRLRTRSKRELRHLLETGPSCPFQLPCGPGELSFSCWVVGTCECGPKGDSERLGSCRGCDDKERRGSGRGDKGGRVSGQAGGRVGDWAGKNLGGWAGQVGRRAYGRLDRWACGLVGRQLEGGWAGEMSLLLIERKWLATYGVPPLVNFRLVLPLCYYFVAWLRGWLQVCVLSILVVVFGSSLNPLQALLLIMLPCQPIRLQVYGIPTCPAVQTPVEDESYSVSVSVTW